MGLIANLPAVNDRQLAQDNHNEVMRAIRGLTTRVNEMDRNLNARMDGLGTRMDGLETRLDGLETRLMAK